MSDLRDARFKRALDSAPDVPLRPDPRTRHAIQVRAHGVVTPAAGAGRWRRLLGPSGQRMPWSAALATVALATLVTVMWHDREIPGAQPDATAPAAPAAAPAPARQPQPAPAAIPASPPDSRAASAPAARARPAAKPAPEPRRQELGQAPPAAAPARERGPERPALKDEASRALAKSAPQRAESSRAADSAAVAPPAAPAAPPAVAADRAPTPAAGLASQLRRAPAAGAARLRIVGEGRTVDAVLEDRSRLADLLGHAAGMAQGAEPLAAAPDMRVELRRRGEPAGVLELAGPQLRWTPPGGEGGGTARPDLAFMQALREELERLLR